MDELCAAVESLRTIVLSLEGCEAFLIYAEVGDEMELHVFEIWTAREFHELSSAAIPKAAFAPIMAALSKPPAVKDLLQISG